MQRRRGKINSAAESEDWGEEEEESVNGITERKMGRGHEMREEDRHQEERGR